MASQGPNFPGTGADDNAVGTQVWSNPGYITADDTNYASCSAAGSGSSHYLKGTNPAFTIPSGSTINGIELTINRRSFANSGNQYTVDNIVKLVKGGTVQGNDKADTVNHWPTSLTDKVYGGSSDLWGLSWSAADINASNFGAVLSAKWGITGGFSIFADYYTFKVYYTPPGGGVKFCAVLCSKFNGVAVSKFNGVA